MKRSSYRRAALLSLVLGAAPASAGGLDILDTDERFARLYVPGALTSVQVAERTLATSPVLRAKRQGVRGAEAKVDETAAKFIPQLSANARFTRLSPITMPPLATGGGGSMVVSNVVLDQARPYNPATDSLFLAPAPSFSFPIFLNQWNLGATLAVPLSDYFMRYRDAIEATSGAAEAARLELEAAVKKADYDARTMYYQYIRSEGQKLVATQALEAAEGHRSDARAAFQAGFASKADVLRAESAVMQVELFVERAANGVDVAAEALRTLMHTPGAAIVIGENVLDPLARGDEDTPLEALVAEALRERPEARAIAVGTRSAERQKSLARAAYFPRLDLVGNGTYANPNQRFTPNADRFDFTWDASVVASWSPTEAFSATAQANQAEAKRLELEAQRDSLADGVRIEVNQAKTALHEARSNLETTKHGLTSATESYRIRREAYRAGKATLVEVYDAGSDLTRARLEFVDANVALRLATLRLGYACGRGPSRP
jgi:outer membrane protein TolC